MQCPIHNGTLTSLNLICENWLLTIVGSMQSYTRISTAGNVKELSELNTFKTKTNANIFHIY